MALLDRPAKGGFDPASDAFIPRAFSLTHVNLTARNWTAVGVPDCDLLPIVDPRGLVTPFWDGWSLDAWIVTEDGASLVPSRGEGVPPLRLVGILPAPRGMGFQPMNHRQDADATKNHGQDARATEDRGQDARATEDRGQDARDAQERPRTEGPPRRAAALRTEGVRLATWQCLDLTNGLAVVTSSRLDALELESRTEVVAEPELACQVTLRAGADRPAWLVVSARPCNPEGVSFIHRISLNENGDQWWIDRRRRVLFSEPAQRCAGSDYAHGDVFHRLFHGGHEPTIVCDVGLATAAALFEIRGGHREIVVHVPLRRGEGVGGMGLGSPLGAASAPSAAARRASGAGQKVALGPEGRCAARGVPFQPMNHRQDADATKNRGQDARDTRGRDALDTRDALATDDSRRRWAEELDGACRVHVPDEHMQHLYEAALRTVILHSPGDIYPGPFTYKRFWFRDAAFILQAMLCAGLSRRASQAIQRFFPRQTAGGYFRSQEGEWDANGEVLWILERYCRLVGVDPPAPWAGPVTRAAHWIVRKRFPDDKSAPCAGLLPAGFSAEHLGPNDYYYWDDFWSVAGLRSAAAMLSALGKDRDAERFRREADEFMGAIGRSLERVRTRLHGSSMPASCRRRLDSGAIGSIVAGYPLQLFDRRDDRLLDTVNYLLDRCMVAGGFFQDMIHSGINMYLTMHLAQVLLRAGDMRFAALVRTAADFASPTGQWPEAIHPRTRGGCMGDGQHTWAAAEWIMMMRNGFLYEETAERRLVIGAGLLPEWLRPGNSMSIGPAPTLWGPVHITIEVSHEDVHVCWESRWRRESPEIEIRVPGLASVTRTAGRGDVSLGSKE